MLQGSVAVFYNWLKIEHTWVTDLIKDYAVRVSYVGLSTKDRRFIYPQKEVRHTRQALVLIVPHKQSQGDTACSACLNAHASAFVYVACQFG